MMVLILNFLIVLFTASATAEYLLYYPVENNCTRVTPAASQDDIIGQATVRSWSFPSDNCATFNYKIDMNGHTDAVFSSKSDPSYSGLRSNTREIGNPMKPGEFQGYQSFIQLPVSVTTIAVCIAEVGFALVICPFQNGTVEMNGVILTFGDPSQSQIANLTQQFRQLFPQIALNPVRQTPECNQ
ncbi:hypothetical protein CHUAL_000205 [Chamberlinius hualienensis]